MYFLSEECISLNIRLNSNSCSLKTGTVEVDKWKVSPPLGLKSRDLRLNSFPIHPVPAGPLGFSEPSGKNSPEDNKQSKLGY